MDPAQGILLQYGAVGLIALIALWVALRLWARIEAAYEKEAARADRLERELHELNMLISERLAGDLVRATEVMRSVLEIVKQQEYEKRRGGDRP